MHKKVTMRLIPALIAVTFSGGAFASGFQLSEQSASGIGVANAGAGRRQKIQARSTLTRRV